MFLGLLLAMCLCVCAPADRAGPAAAFARGGSIAVDDMPTKPVARHGDVLEIWGATEVPANSRPQAAFAMVDAVTRSEFIQFIRVEVTSLDLDIQPADHAVVVARLDVVAKSLMPSGRMIDHGWERRGEVMHLVGRLRVSRASFRAAYQNAYPDLDAAALDAVVNHVYGVLP